jgi:NAD(P)-dependent dehydrogenase (short-subunit alcohol dehydrogenase family)
VRNETLSGKTALVIGASSGIGLATVNLFANAGARVHAAARRREAIEDGAGERGVVAHKLDVSDREAVWRVVQEVGEADGIDALVVAAGMNFPERRLEQLTAENWDAMISVNLSGAFYAIRAALPFLRASRGIVILISSVSGSWPDMSGPAYQASKAGMTELAHAAGFEEHVNGVRFSAVLPGIVDTPILDNRPEPPPKEVRDLSLKPEDVAAACLFLVTLPPRAYVPELTILPTEIQALGKTSTATPPTPQGEE